MGPMVDAFTGDTSTGLPPDDSSRGDDLGMPQDTGAGDGPVSPQDSSLDAPELAPCGNGAQVFYVDGAPGNPIVTGSALVSGSEASWDGTLASGTALTMDVTLAGSGELWQLTLEAPFTGPGLGVGTYEDAGTSRDAPIIGLSVGSGTCAFPDGSFTIYDLQSTGGDSAQVTRLLTSFEVRCPDAGGPVRGCVRYNE
jgi:hypothetical protein